jgi:tetratricopeptide (TPR) repeat protein
VLSALKRSFLDHLIFWVAVVATVVVYFNSLHYPFISWDDPEMVFKNKDVIHFNLKAFFTNHYVGNYIPLTMLTHAVNWLLFDHQVIGHHLVNLFIHIANGYLVYKLSTQLFKEKGIAQITAILFLLHPLQTESVNWIAELKNLGYALFYLLGLLSYVNYVSTKNKKQFFYTLLFFALSCLYKPSAVVFPLSLLCMDLLLGKKIDSKLLLNKIPLLFISVLFGLINLRTQAADQFINFSHAFPFYERMANAGYALFKYASLFLAPYNLSVIYPFPTERINTLVLGGVFGIAISIAVYILYKKHKQQLLGITLFSVVNLMLVLQFIPFGEVLYADRYMYVPIIGFAWLLAFTLSKLRVKPILIPIALIFILGSVTFLRSQQWKSSIVLYEDIIKKYPNNFLALNSLGVENMMKSNDDKALQYFNRATNVAPNNYKGFYNRGLLYLKNNNPKKAIDEFNQVFQMYDYSKAYVARASAYYALMQYKPARMDAQTALMKDKQNHRALFVLGNCDNDENNIANAIVFYNRAIELNNDEPDYYFKRSIAYGKQQQFTNCLNDLNTCLQLNPNYVDAYYWRGVAKVNLKQNPCEDFRRGAENNDNSAKEAYQRLCK